MCTRTLPSHSSQRISFRWIYCWQNQHRIWDAAKVTPTLSNKGRGFLKNLRFNNYIFKALLFSLSTEGSRATQGERFRQTPHEKHQTPALRSNNCTNALHAHSSAPRQPAAHSPTRGHFDAFLTPAGASQSRELCQSLVTSCELKLASNWTEVQLVLSTLTFIIHILLNRNVLGGN